MNCGVLKWVWCHIICYRFPVTGKVMIIGCIVGIMTHQICCLSSEIFRLELGIVVVLVDVVEGLIVWVSPVGLIGRSEWVATRLSSWCWNMHIVQRLGDYWSGHNRFIQNANSSNCRKILVQSISMDLLKSVELIKDFINCPAKSGNSGCFDMYLNYLLNGIHIGSPFRLQSESIIE